MIENIRFLGHGGFVIQDTPIIYINPWRVTASAFHGDFILITHDHYDHYSSADIAKLKGAHTQILTNRKVAQDLPQATIIRPFQYFQANRATIRAMPAYNPDAPSTREDEGLGFVISLNFYDIYYTGDSKLLPEMRSLQPDILMLPIDDDNTFSLYEAVEAVDIIRPRWVLPFNWGADGIGATYRDALRFKDLVGARAEVVLPVEK